MATFWQTASANAFNTTLNGNVGASDTSITLTSTTSLNAPGVLVIDRQSSAGVSTPSLREYISYTGIATNTLTGVTRGLANSTQQAHTSGAIVEEVFSTTHWMDLLTLMLNVFTSNGALDTTKVTDLNSSQTLTNKSLTTPTLTSPVNTVSVVSGTSPTLNLNNGNVFTITLSGSATFSVSNATPGQVFMVEVTQGSGTSYTATWFSGVTWVTSGSTAPTQTTTSNGITTYGFRCTGSNAYDGYLVGTQ